MLYDGGDSLLYLLARWNAPGTSFRESRDRWRKMSTLKMWLNLCALEMVDSCVNVVIFIMYCYIYHVYLRTVFIYIDFDFFFNFTCGSKIV